MNNIFGKLLCWLGYHKWDVDYKCLDPGPWVDLPIGFYTKHWCERCLKSEIRRNWNA